MILQNALGSGCVKKFKNLKQLICERLQKSLSQTSTFLLDLVTIIQDDAKPKFYPDSKSSINRLSNNIQCVFKIFE